ncbi:MAG TPA: molybdopterin cofactor-binding domain-containing protein, partial [Candidatus Acidoferrales bacterium]|nr:molybdopterin cofactor-binding domain-containing protein [Candidatus Acidoferrales bacterium]
MPSWPSQTKYIGGETRRIDAPPKVSGLARYSSDIQAPGWLYGMIFRSNLPAAKIGGINLDKARQVPGIKAAITVGDGERTVHFYGEELAAVAGTTKQACLDALRAIEVDATPLPFVVNETEAKKDDAPQVMQGSPNAAEPRTREHGSVDTAFPECAAVIEGFYTTPVQIHNPMETHGSTASWTSEGVTPGPRRRGFPGFRTA